MNKLTHWSNVKETSKKFNFLLFLISLWLLLFISIFPRKNCWRETALPPKWKEGYFKYELTTLQFNEHTPLKMRKWKGKCKSDQAWQTLKRKRTLCCLKEQHHCNNDYHYITIVSFFFLCNSLSWNSNQLRPLGGCERTQCVHFELPGVMEAKWRINRNPQVDPPCSNANTLPFFRFPPFPMRKFLNLPSAANQRCNKCKDKSSKWYGPPLDKANYKNNKKKK